MNTCIIPGARLVAAKDLRCGLYVHFRHCTNCKMVDGLNKLLGKKVEVVWRYPNHKRITGLFKPDYLFAVSDKAL